MADNLPSLPVAANFTVESTDLQKGRPHFNGMSLSLNLA